MANPKAAAVRLQPMKTDGATPEQIFIATIQRRHYEAEKRLDAIAPRTEDNGEQYDIALGEHLALQNSMMAAYENSDLDPAEIMLIANLGEDHD